MPIENHLIWSDTTLSEQVKVMEQKTKMSQRQLEHLLSDAMLKEEEIPPSSRPPSIKIRLMYVDAGKIFSRNWTVDSVDGEKEGAIYLSALKIAGSIAQKFDCDWKAEPTIVDKVIKMIRR